MDKRPTFFYVTYPMPIEMAEAFPFPGEVDAPKPEKETRAVPLAKDTDFEPFWYGNARFPEDDNL